MDAMKRWAQDTKDWLGVNMQQLPKETQELIQEIAGMNDAEIQARLEYLRRELRGERISYAELAELQSLATHIAPGDVELLEPAGVPEFPEDEDPGVEAANRAGEEMRRLRQENRTLRAAVSRAIPWLGKLIADGGHLNSVAPNDAIGALQQMEAAINPVVLKDGVPGKRLPSVISEGMPGTGTWTIETAKDKRPDVKIKFRGVICRGKVSIDEDQARVDFEYGNAGLVSHRDWQAVVESLNTGIPLVDRYQEHGI